MLRKHLLPIFADMPLREMDVITLQKCFSGMKANYPTAVKIKDVRASTLESAVRFRAADQEPAFRRAAPSAKTRKAQQTSHHA